MKEYRTENGLRFWHAYFEGVKLEYVRRSGFGLCGVYGEYDVENVFFDKRRPQSDAEHCYGMSRIQTLLALYYPEVISFEDFFSYHFLTELHELGENATGDIADDGTRDNREKDLDEKQYVFNHLAKCYPREFELLGKILFTEFQEKKNVRGQNFYLTDKADAILRNLAYESFGVGGDINFKCKNYYTSEKDREGKNATCSNCPADIWFYNLLKSDAVKFKNIDVITEIIQSAAYAVRGYEMEWVNKLFPQI